MSPPQQAPRKSCDGWTICFYCGVLLFAGFYIAAALCQQDGPRFTVAALSVSAGRVAFNVSDSYPNRHYGISISYKSAPSASLLFDDDGAPITSGQINMSTTSITAFTSVLDVIDGPRFSAALRASRGRLPLRLQLAAPISFRVLNVFPSVKQNKNMRVDCHLLVGANGSLLRESMGAPCYTSF